MIAVHRRTTAAASFWCQTKSSETILGVVFRQHTGQSIKRTLGERLLAIYMQHGGRQGYPPKGEADGESKSGQLAQGNGKAAAAYSCYSSDVTYAAGVLHARTRSWAHAWWQISQRLLLVSLQKRRASAHLPLPPAPGKDDYKEKVPASLAKLMALKVSVSACLAQ